MKKILVLLSVFFCGFSAMAQSFTGPTSIPTGGEITLTAKGESFVGTDFTTPYYYFINIQAVDETKSVYQSGPANPAQYVHVSLKEVTNLFTPLNQRPSTIIITATNTSSSPIMVTFYILTQYGYQPNSSTGAVYIPYTVTIQPKPVVIIPAPNNGDFVRNTNTGKVFMFFEGKLRYIPTTATLNGLFKFSEAATKNYTAAQIATLNLPVGTDFSQDSRLLLDTNTGGVYLRESTLIRLYPSAEIANAYHINWDYLLKVNGISGYTLGAPIHL